MKKKLGALVLTLAALVISAACASSGYSSEPKQPQPDTGEMSVQARPSELPNRPADATADQTTRVAR